jgi:hypothetical protein
MADENDWDESDHPVTADEIRHIIHENKELFGRSWMSQWIGVVIVIWLAFAGFSEAWYSKLRYVVWYGTDWSSATIDKQPHDCDLLAAPLGEKNCRYDAQVQIQKISTDRNSGRSIISYDGGKTWDFNDGPNAVTGGMQIHVAWQKVDY